MTTIFDRIAVDFSFTYRDQVKGKDYDPEIDVSKPQMLGIKAVVHNRTNRTISVKGLKAKAVPMLYLDTYDPKIMKREHSGIMRLCNIDIPVNGSQEIEMGIMVDWKKLKAGYSSGSRSPALRASVIIDRKTLLKPIASRTHIHEINEAIIMQNDEKAIQCSAAMA